MRGLIPIAAGAASGFGWWLHSWTAQVGSFTLVPGVNQLLLGHSEIADFHLVRDTVHSLWQLTGLILAWELRWEIRALAWYLITLILFILHWIYLAFIWLGGVGFPGFGNLASPPHQQLPRTERGPDLTCMAAAIAPAAGGGGGAPPFPVGSFLLITRPPDWDEVWLASYTTTRRCGLSNYGCCWRRLGVGGREIGPSACEGSHGSTGRISKGTSWIGCQQYQLDLCSPRR